MTVLSCRDRARCEVTRRLLAQVVNEGLVSAAVSTDKSQLCLKRTHPVQMGPQNQLVVGLDPNTHFHVRSDHVASLLRPEDLILPVMLEDVANGYDRVELDPVAIFNFISSWMAYAMGQMTSEKGVLHLQNSLDLQEKWFEIASTREVLDLKSSSVAWEQSLVVGHPSHPFHKICVAEPPLLPVGPDNLAEVLTPTLSFVSILRTDLIISGPFEATLKPLLQKLDIAEPPLDRIIVPCFHRQLPAVLPRFPSAVVIKSVKQCANALSSIRTVALKPELQYNYHIKLSIAYQITSVIRLIRKGEACAAPIMTELLEKLRPAELWLYREVAAVTANQSNPRQAQYLACVLREDLEQRAKANHETLIVAAAFMEKPFNNHRIYAEVLFSLETEEQKRNWFRSYIKQVFALTLPLLVHYGIGLEAHSQNMVARVCLKTKEIKGFVARDFSGMKIHLPTLKKQGLNLDSEFDIKGIFLDDIQELWERTHQIVLQNHAGHLLSALGLAKNGGWIIVREELEKVLDPFNSAPGRELYEYFLKNTMKFKCFLRMNLDGTLRWNITKDLSNIVLG